MEITLKIPTKSYLRKYVAASFGDNIKLSERNWLGIIILNIVKRKTFHNNYDFKDIDGKYPIELPVKMSVAQSSRHGCVLLPTQIYYINLALDNFFKSEIIKQALINHSAYGIDFKVSIQNMLDAYDITDEELDYQTIRKYFNRNYKKYENRIIL